MQFTRIDPKEELKNLVECYWIVENDDPTPILQKIIPDGFPEMIFHFGDPYTIRLGGPWEVQSRNLLAGQITSHFFLKNTGRSCILGIKFRPAALTHLFNISMHGLTNRVVDLSSVRLTPLLSLESAIKNAGHVERIDVVQDQLIKMIPENVSVQPVEKAIALIFSSKGMMAVTEICAATGTSERQLERLFKKYIGLSPKFYARIIRFSYIFQVVREKKMNGSELGLESGFYDQSHFIKNFKAFTGEDPSRYFFDQPNLANFFLKK